MRLLGIVSSSFDSVITSTATFNTLHINCNLPNLPSFKIEFILKCKIISLSFGKGDPLLISKRKESGQSSMSNV